jgi:hypothetical protein
LSKPGLNDDVPAPRRGRSLIWRRVARVASLAPIAPLASLSLSVPLCQPIAEPLDRVAREAGRVHGVPRELLLSLAYADTRGSAAANPRAHAANLGAAARAAGVAPSSPLARWHAPLLAAHAGRDPVAASLHVGEVMLELSRGFRGVDASGSPFSVAPHPEIAPPPAPAGDEVTFLGEPGVARWRAAASTHRPARSSPRRVTHIVIHTMEGTFPTIVELFRREGTPVGAHYVVRASDGLIAQMVDERDVAFHDGCFNEATIGVEHEGFAAEGRRWFSEAALRASARLVVGVARRHDVPLDRQHVIGHGEAPDCSDHTDPGPAWDWQAYMHFLEEAAAE